MLNISKYTRYVILINQEKDYTTEVINMHAKHLKRLDENGELTICGPFKDYEGGIMSFVKFLNDKKTPIHIPIHLKKTKGDIELEVALQYTTAYSESVFSFVNNINTSAPTTLNTVV